MRIILADDHAMVRDGLRPFLLELSNDVEIIETDRYSGILDKIENNGTIDLILLDLDLPDREPLGGIQAVLEAARPGKVVVMSSSVDHRVMTRVLGLGVDGYAPKRLSARAIVSVLLLAMAGEIYVPSILFAQEGFAPATARHCPSEGGPPLTSREREVLSLLRDGMSNKAIARRLNVTEVTIKSHLCHVFKKLGVQNRLQAASFRQGWFA